MMTQISKSVLFMRTVASSPVKLMLISIYGLTAILFYWAITYKIKPSASGIGMIARRGEIIRIYSPVAGRIIKINVKQGQFVKKGTLIAEIDNEEEKIKASSTKQIETVSTQKAQEQVKSSKESTRKQIDAVRMSKQELVSQINKNKILVEKMKLLTARNEISYAEYVAQVNVLEALKLQELQLKGKIQDFEANLAYSIQNAESNRIMNKADAQIANHELFLSKRIEAPTDGIIGLIDVSNGDAVNQGDSIAQLSYNYGALKGVFLMSAEMAKRVRKGDECLVTPAESPPERYGYIRATASSIGMLPTNPGEFTRKLGVDYTAQKLFENLQAIENSNYSVFPYMVVVELNVKNNSPVWTTGAKPPWGLSNGGAGSVQCFYDSWNPISYIIPLIRKESGFQTRY